MLNNSNLVTEFFPTTEPAITIFEACKRGERPLFQDNEGWVSWPQVVDESEVLSWFQETFRHVVCLAAENGLVTQSGRHILTLPDRPLHGHVAQRKLEIGLVHDVYMRVGCFPHRCTPSHEKPERPDWSQVLAAGELKQNVEMDNSQSTWLNLSRYARTVFKEQDLRQFRLGFTLCAPQMRPWYIDRAGGVSSPSFNINEDGQALNIPPFDFYLPTCQR